MAAVGAPGPHGTFVSIAIELIISTSIPSSLPQTLRLATKSYLKFFCNSKTPETYNFLVQNGRFLQKIVKNTKYVGSRSNSGLGVCEKLATREK